MHVTNIYENALSWRTLWRVTWVLLCVLMVFTSTTGCARTRRRVRSALPSVLPSSAPPAQEPAPETTPAMWPVEHPALRITSPYGASRGGRLHKGIDMAVPQGTPVMATASGQTAFSGWQGGYGNIIIICHGNGYETAYAHLQRRFMSNGERVRRGQTIGLVGATGNATGPHLHYEVRRQSVPVNPEPWLP